MEAADELFKFQQLNMHCSCRRFDRHWGVMVSLAGVTCISQWWRCLECFLQH